MAHEPRALNYEDFASWHAVAHQRLLEPARAAGVRLLHELLDSKVPEIDRARFRISTSRVKSPQRTFSKLNTEKYLGRFQGMDDIPSLIDDLVGVRLVCNNLSDINTFQEIIGELPQESAEVMSLAVEGDSQRDYFASPKPSGYRAFHVNFVVPVPQANQLRRIRVEVQARTLLQDGWGELTHEDTYKPGSRVPDWIVGMSLRMSELLAAVDNIAQDLRVGLDVETQRQVEQHVPDPAAPHLVLSEDSTDPESDGDPLVELDPPGPQENSALQSALRQEARTILSRITTPTALAVISQDLIAKFGMEVTREWAQFGGFVKFLSRAVPEVAVTGPQPGYAHPFNESPPAGWEVEWSESGGAVGPPELVKALRLYDKAIPLISPTRMTQLLAAVAEAIHSVPDDQLTSYSLDELARKARAIGEARGQLVVRPHAAWVLSTLKRLELLLPSISLDQIGQVLTVALLAAAERRSLVTDREVGRAALQAWLSV